MANIAGSDGLYGVFWNSADGNIYTQGNDGVIVNQGKNLKTAVYKRDDGSIGYGFDTPTFSTDKYRWVGTPEEYRGGTTGQTGNGDTGQIDNAGGYYSGGYSAGGSTAPQYSARDEQAAYDDQISAIERLLGYTNTQKDSGLATLNDRYNSEKRTLDTQRTRAMNDYAAKDTQNTQDREKGMGEVDSFANSSYSNLQRLLQGSNAGSSSVARELMPYLVSRAATTRRTGVVDTAGKNAQSIASARDDAEYQYGQNAQELENQKKANEQSFIEQIYGKQNDLQSQMKDLQIKRQMATGQGYAQARSAGDAAQASINERQAALASLFGQYKPTFTARAMSTKSPELSQFTVDKAAINSSNPNLPAESSFYQTQLKKKQELAGL